MARKGRGKPAAAPKPKFDVEEIRPYVTDEWGRVAKEVEKYEERHHKNIRKSVGRLRAAYNAAMRKLQETGEAEDFQVEIAEQVKKGNDLGKVKGELNNELGDIKAGPMIKLLYSVQENISSKVAEVTGATTTEMKARAADPVEPSAAPSTDVVKRLEWANPDEVAEYVGVVFRSFILNTTSQFKDELTRGGFLKAEETISSGHFSDVRSLLDRLGEVAEEMTSFVSGKAEAKESCEFSEVQAEFVRKLELLRPRAGVAGYRMPKLIQIIDEQIESLIKGFQAHECDSFLNIRTVEGDISAAKIIMPEKDSLMEIRKSKKAERSIDTIPLTPDEKATIKTAWTSKRGSASDLLNDARSRPIRDRIINTVNDKYHGGIKLRNPQDLLRILQEFQEADGGREDYHGKLLLKAAMQYERDVLAAVIKAEAAKLDIDEGVSVGEMENIVQGLQVDKYRDPILRFNGPKDLSDAGRVRNFFERNGDYTARVKKELCSELAKGGITADQLEAVRTVDFPVAMVLDELDEAVTEIEVQPPNLNEIIYQEFLGERYESGWDGEIMEVERGYLEDWLPVEDDEEVEYGEVQVALNDEFHCGFSTRSVEWVETQMEILLAEREDRRSVEEDDEKEPSQDVGTEGLDRRVDEIIEWADSLPMPARNVVFDKRLIRSLALGLRRYRERGLDMDPDEVEQLVGMLEIFRRLEKRGNGGKSVTFPLPKATKAEAMKPEEHLLTQLLGVLLKERKHSDRGVVSALDMRLGEIHTEIAATEAELDSFAAAVQELDLKRRELEGRNSALEVLRKKVDEGVDGEPSLIEKEAKASKDLQDHLTSVAQKKKRFDQKKQDRLYHELLAAQKELGRTREEIESIEEAIGGLETRIGELEAQLNTRDEVGSRLEELRRQKDELVRTVTTSIRTT